MGEGDEHQCMPLSVMLTYPHVHSRLQTTPATLVPLLATILAGLALLPLFFREPEGTTAAQREASESKHDRWNLLLLPPLCLGLVLSWLCLVSPFLVTLSLLAYVVADGCYIALSDQCAVRLPRVVLAHHAITLCFLLVPLHHVDLAEFTAVAGAAELQTLALVLRRRLRREQASPTPAMPAAVLSALLGAMGLCHDVVFVAVRLVLHPLLLLGVFTRMHLPATEALIVRSCQVLLCAFNTLLFCREFTSRNHPRRP